MDRQVTKTDAGVYTKVDCDQENGIKRDRREFGSKKRQKEEIEVNRRGMGWDKFPLHRSI